MTTLKKKKKLWDDGVLDWPKLTRVNSLNS